MTSPVTGRTPSVNLGLNFFFFCLEAFSRIINFSYSFKSIQSANCRPKGIKLNLLWKHLCLNYNFALLTLGYCKTALNNLTFRCVSVAQSVSAFGCYSVPWGRKVGGSSPPGDELFLFCFFLFYLFVLSSDFFMLWTTSTVVFLEFIC